MTERLLGRAQGASRVGQHLLLLPEGTREADVTGLVVARHPGAAVHPGAELRIGRRAALHGPLHLDAGAAAGAAVPSPWRLAWALASPVERDDALLPGLSDRDGLTRAFPDGLPVAGERRALDLLLGLARRLRGAVRCAGRGALLAPDPLAWPGLDVRTARPVDAAAVAAILAGTDAPLEMAAEQVLLAPLAGGCLEVVLEPDDGLSSGGSTAALRWWPDEPEEAEHERPSLAYRERRAAAIVTISVMARHLVGACGGSVVDVGGLPVRDLG